MRKTIALDMDEVVVDIYARFHSLYKTQYGAEPVVADYAGGKFYDLPGAAHFRDFLFEPGFFADLPIFPGARDVIAWLYERYDVFIVTAAQEFPHSLPDKYRWLQEHLPFISWKRYVFCGDKSIVHTDYMLDDHAYNLRNFRGTPLLFSAPHNLGMTVFTRLDNWEEVRTYFEKELAGGA